MDRGELSAVEKSDVAKSRLRPSTLKNAPELLLSRNDVVINGWRNTVCLAISLYSRNLAEKSQ